MPTEVSLPNLATYVVRDEKEGDARYEEIPVSDIGYNQYETLGIPNEAVQYDKLNAPSSSTNPSKDLGNLNRAVSYDEMNLSISAWNVLLYQTEEVRTLPKKKNQRISQRYRIFHFLLAF